jgi:hypothetical protein
MPVSSRYSTPSFLATSRTLNFSLISTAGQTTFDGHRISALKVGVKLLLAKIQIPAHRIPRYILS